MKKMMKISGNKGTDIVAEFITAGKPLKKKYLRRDLAMLVILAIGTQFFSGLERMEQAYIHGAVFAVTFNEVKDGCGTGCVNGYEECRRAGVTKAKALLKEAETAAVISQESVVETVAAAEPKIDRMVTDTPAIEDNVMRETAVSLEAKESISASDRAGVAEQDKTTEVPDREFISEEKEETAASETTDENIADKMLHLDGFIVNEEGVLLSCENPEIAAQDGVIILPTDLRCTEIGAEAFDNVTWAEELYIPANITAIAPEALQKLKYLIYIEVDPANPIYEGIEGRLYNKNGELLVSPAGR